MEFLNATRMIAGYNMAIDRTGRENLVVAVKGTFRIPQPGEAVTTAVLHDEQVPLTMADTFTGEPGFSAPVYEVDYTPQKAFCDVMLLGQAHAPQGRPTTRVEVGMQIGQWSKRFAVVGSRHWDAGLATLRATPPEPFTTQPISYDVAYGGVDLAHDDPAQHAAYLLNPVGCGFHKHLRRAWIDGKPLPRTEEIGRLVSDPDSDYQPMSFGPVGRGWQPRAAYAGTYDDEWREKHFPFLPPDFDAKYFQAVGTDQQLPLDFLSHGPVEVVLCNLTPQGLTRFVLPAVEAPVHVFTRRGERHDFNATLDTIVIEPDEQRFSLTWRVTHPLRRNMHELGRVLVGRKSAAWWQQQRSTVLAPIVAATP